MKNLNLKIFILLSTLSVLCFSFLIPYYPDRDYQAFSDINVKGLNKETNLCFSGLDSYTKVLLIKDENLSNINNLISNEFYLKDSVYTSSKTRISNVRYNSEEKMYVLNMESFSFDFSRTYCIVLRPLTDISSIKNLTLQGASSDKPDRMKYSEVRNFADLQLYSTPLDNSASMTLGLSSNNPFEPSTIMLDTKFTMNVVLTTNIPTNRLLNTKDEQIVIHLGLPNMNLDKANISIVNEETNPLKFENQPVFEIRKNLILVSKLGVDLRNGNRFLLRIQNIQMETLNTDIFTATVSLFWKNTNSMVSFFRASLNKTMTKYELNDLSMAHTNKIPAVYSNASWPVEITFSVNTKIVNGSVILTSTNGAISFLPSTCEFYQNKVSNSECFGLSSFSIKLSNVNLLLNEKFTLIIWVHINQIDSSIILDSPISIILENLTNSKIFRPTFKIKKGELPSSSFYDYSSEYCDMETNPLNCNNNRLLVIENSGNLAVTENNIDSIINQTVNYDSLNGLSKKENKYFRLRSRYLTTSHVSNSFVGDWTISNSQNVNASGYTTFLRGNHNIFFPSNIYSRSRLQSCTLDWDSSVNSKNTVNKVNLSPSAAQNFIRFDTLSFSATSLSFSNYSTNNLNTSITVGFFHNLLKQHSCGENGNCTESPFVINNVNNSMFNDLSSNCFEVSSQLSHKSKFASYDLNHLFFTKNNQDVANLVRFNRFVSLLPQPGLFYNANTSSFISFPASNSITKISGMEFMCILEINVKNDGNTTDFYAFIDSMNFIDFDDMNDYPSTNPNGLSVTKNRSSNRVNSYLSFGDLNVSRITQGTMSLFNKSTYNSYFGDLLKFGTSNLQNSNILIPTKCNTGSSHSYAFSSISNNYMYTVSHAVAAQYQYYFTREISNDFSNNRLLIPGSWDSFNYERNTKLTFQSNLSVNNFASDKLNYIILLSKSTFTNDFRLLDSTFSEVRTSYYQELYSSNAFTINNIRFNNMLILKKEDINFSNNLKNGNNFDFGFKGVNIPVNDVTAVNNNDLAIFGGVDATNFPTDGYYLSNYDGLNYIINRPNTLNILNDTLVIKNLSYVTKNLKAGLGSVTACVNVVLEVLPNINYFEIHSNNFTPITIAEFSNSSNEFSYFNKYFKAKFPDFTDKSKSIDVNITFCNVDVSSQKKFIISKIVMFYKDSLTEYINYTFTNAEIRTTIPANLAYENSVISGFNYGYDRLNYGNLLITASLGHEVFRNMVLTISSETFSQMYPDEHFGMNCEVSFNSNFSHPHDVVFETCKVDFQNRRLIITTFNSVKVHEALLSKLFIRVFPTKIVNLDNSAFIISARFNQSNNVALFPEVGSKITTNEFGYKFNSFNTMDLSNLMEISNILPVYPGIKGTYEITINLKNNVEIGQYINNNNIVGNEMRLMFPIKYFGVISNDEIYCYVNDILVENCTFIQETIYVRTNFDLKDDIKVGIYGFIIPDSSKINANDSVVLMSIGDRKIFTRNVYFYGKMRLNPSFDRTVYLKQSSSKVANLRIASNSFSRLSALLPSDLTLNLAIDNLGGLPDTNTFTLTNLKDSYIYVVLPTELYFLNSDNYTSYSRNSNGSNILLSANQTFVEEGKSTVKDVEITTSEVTVYGNTIVAKITGTFEVTALLNFFTVKITNIVNDADRMGLVHVEIARKDEYLLKTFTLLNSSIGYLPDIEGNNVLTKLPPSQRVGFMEYYRGSNFVYLDTQYYFESETYQDLQPGIFKELKLQIKSNGSIPQASTKISVRETTQIRSLLGEILINSNTNNSVSHYVGINCSGIPGNYIIRFNLSNNVEFSTPKNIFLTVPNNVSKNIVQFYSEVSGLNAVVYNPNSPIIFGKGGYASFWVKADAINIDAIDIQFERRINDGTTVLPPDTLSVPKENKNFIRGTYNSSDISITSIQSYNIFVKNNDCFVAQIDRISFQANLSIESFEEFEIQMDDFLYINADSDYINEQFSTNISADELRVVVNLQRGNTLPIPSNIYCALFCSERDPLTYDELKEEYPTQDWFVRYFKKQIKSSDVFMMSFNEIARDNEYSLQCLLESTEVDPSKRSRATRIIKNSNSRKIYPKPTPILECVDFFVKNLSENMNQNLHYIVNRYFNENTLDNGCVTVLNSRNELRPGYENDYRCHKTTSIPYSNTNENQEVEQVVERSGSFLRYLQSNSTDSNTTSNNTNNDLPSNSNNNTTNNTSNNNSTIVDTNSPLNHLNITDEEWIGEYKPNYHRFCLVQQRKCKTTISNERIDTLLSGLLDKRVSYRRNSLLSNLTLEEKNALPLVTVEEAPLVSTKLSNEELSNYLGYRRFKVSEKFDMNKLNLYVSYESNFNTTMINGTNMTHIYIYFNGNSNTGICYWSLNSNTNPEANVSVREIVECDDSKNLLCSSSLGQVIPSRYSAFFDIQKLKDKEYGLWVTCKENTSNARDFTKPMIAARINSYHEKIYQEKVSGSLFKDMVLECREGHNYFPHCCSSGKADKKNKAVCFSSFINLNVFLMLMLLIFMN